MKHDKFAVRLSASEKSNLFFLAKKFGYEKNVSHFVRRRCFENHLLYEDIIGKKEICFEINKIGININQSVKSINTIAKKNKHNKNEFDILNQQIIQLISNQKELINLIDEKLFVNTNRVDVEKNADNI